MTSIPLLIRGVDFCDCLASNLGWVIQVDNDVDDLVVDVCFLVVVVTPAFIEEIENCTVRHSPRLKEKLLRRNVQRFRGGLVCKAFSLLYHLNLGSRVMKKT